MATVRIGKLTASGSIGNSATVRVKTLTVSGTVVNNARVHVTSLKVTGTTAPKISTLRIGSLEVDGTVSANATVRINKLIGVQTLALNAFAAKTVEPFDVVSVTAIPTPGTPIPTIYVWRQVSGPSVILSGAAATRALVAPALKDGATIVLGVKGQDASGNLSAERQITITVYPHTIFSLQNGAWVGVPLTSVPSTGAPVVTTASFSKLQVTGTAAVATVPVLGNAVSDHGKTYTWDLMQNFTTPAALGAVRTTAPYSAMGYFDTASQGFRDTSAQGYWAPDKVLSVHDGYLDINMHSETVSGVSTPLVSCVMPDNYQSRLHGVFEVRFKTTQNKKGYKFVGMFWPTSDTWNEGEIDWPEADLTETPRPANAVPGTFSNGNMTFVPPTAQYAATDSSDWHTARTVWNADGMYFYWDGALVWSTTDTSVIPTHTMRIELQAETFINEGTVPADAVGHVLIDYVAAAS